jgi:hypothetical protein
MWPEALVAQSKPYLGGFVVGLKKTTKDIEDIRSEGVKGMLDCTPERDDRRCVNCTSSEAEGIFVHCLTHSICVEVTAFSISLGPEVS